MGGWTLAPLFTAQTAGVVGIYDSNQGTCGGVSGGCAFGSVAAGGSSSFGPATYGTENAVPITPVAISTSAHYNNPGSGGVGTNNSSAVNLFSNPAAVYNSFRPCTLGIDQSCSGYGNFRALPQWNMDVSLTKDIALWKERVGAQFIFLFTNVTNHVLMNVSSSALDLGSPTTFGRLNSQLNTPRNMEFGLRIHF